MRLFLLPYKTGSKSAKALAETMGIKRCSHKRSTTNLTKRTIINWGHSGNDLSQYVLSNTQRVYNPPTKVAVAINKLHCLEALAGAGVNIPPFTTSRDEAMAWIADNQKEVVERHMLRGSGGDGIRIRSHPADVQSAPLYTQYVKKKQEYRVHVIAGQVADVQRKAKRSGATVHDWKIRNLDAGFVFVRGEVSPPEQVIEQALLAMQAVDLDFGAVDVIWNAHESKAYVLEINTACGLEGTTLEVYADGLKNMAEGTALRDWSHWQEVVTSSEPEVTVTTYTDDGRISPPPQFTAQFDVRSPDAPRMPEARMSLRELANARQQLNRQSMSQSQVDHEMRHLYAANGYMTTENPHDIVLPAGDITATEVAARRHESQRRMQELHSRYMGAVASPRGQYTTVDEVLGNSRTPYDDDLPTWG